MPTITGPVTVIKKVVATKGLVTPSVKLSRICVLEADHSFSDDPPAPASLHRTGSASYVTASGTLTTAGDGVPRIGVPGPVVRRNLLKDSGNLLSSNWLKSKVTAAYTGANSDGLTPCYFYETAETGAHYTSQSISAGIGVAITMSIKVSPNGRTWIRIDDAYGCNINFNLTGAGSVGIQTGGIGTIAKDADGAYICSVTFTATGANPHLRLLTLPSDTTAFNFTGDPTKGLIVYWQQMEIASSRSPYQPTNATGVDLTNPLNGAGLVLEGAAINSVLQNNDLSQSPWTNQGVTTAPILGPDGITNGTLLTEAGGSGHRIAQFGIAAGANPGCLSISVKAGTATTSNIVLYAGAVPVLNVQITWTNGVPTATIVSSYGSVLSITPDGTGGWWRISGIQVGTSATNRDLYLIPDASNTGLSTAFADIQYTDGIPFPTSKIRTTTAPATRNADICALAEPSNELCYSHDLTKSSVWTIGGFGTPTKSGDANTLTFTSGVDSVLQVITAHDPTKTSRCVTVKLKQGTATSGLLRFQLRDSGGASRGEVVIDLSKLSSSDWMTFYITATHANLAASIYALCLFDGATPAAAGTTVLVKCFGANEGSFPSPEVQTLDTPIYASGNPVVDPAWWQNGSIEFDVVPPPISTGKSYCLIGSIAGGASSTVFDGAYFALWRWLNPAANNYAMTYERRHNSSSASGRGFLSSSVNIWDGAKHRIRLEWSNYILAGVRYMWHRLYVDGVKIAEIDAASAYGATAWIAPERLWLSDGNTFATLSNVVIGVPELPRDAVPQT